MKINISRKGDLYFVKFWERAWKNGNTLPHLIVKYGVCPNSFRDNDRAVKKYEHTNFLVLDFDNNYPEKLSLMDAQIRIPYKRIIATTKSHQVEKFNGKYKRGKKIHPPQDRFRVFLRLKTPITDPGYFIHIMKFLKHKYPAADEQAMSIVSFFQPGKIYSNDWQNDHLDYIDDELPSLEEYQEWQVAQQEKRKNVTISADHKLSIFSHKWLQSEDEKSWHTKFFIAALDIRQAGFSKEEAIEILTRKTGVLEQDDLARIRNVYQRNPADITPRDGIRMSFEEYARYSPKKSYDDTIGKAIDILARKK